MSDKIYDSPFLLSGFLSGGRSEWHDVNIEVHRNLFSVLLFAVGLDEITKDVGRGILKEFLHANDLVLFDNS